MVKRLTVVKIVIPIFLIFLLSLFVAAEGLEISKKDVRRHIFPGTDGIFEITVKNTRSVSDTFVLDYDALHFYPFSDVLDFITSEPGQLKLEPTKEGKITVKVRTLKTAKQKKNYKLRVWIKSQTEEAVKGEVLLFLNVLPSENLVSVEPLFGKEIAPEQNKLFRFNLKNNIDIPFDASVYVSSELFEGSQNIRLEANDSTKAEFMFDLDPGAKIQEYSYRVNIYLDQDLIGSYSDVFLVTPNPNIREKREWTEGFLQKTLTITKENIGNSPLTVDTSTSATFFEKLFSSFTPEPTKKEKVGKLYNILWTHTLTPGEKYTITIKKNYLSLFAFVLLFALFAAILLYWVLRPVVVQKNVSRKGENLVAHLSIQNRSGFAMKEVEVIDIVPSLLELTGRYGTLEPKKIQTAMHGKKVVWTINQINPHEELLLSYEVSQKLKIHGRIQLPPALVSYKAGHKVVRLKSNSAVLERKELPSKPEHKR